MREPLSKDPSVNHFGDVGFLNKDHYYFINLSIFVYFEEGQFLTYQYKAKLSSQFKTYYQLQIAQYLYISLLKTRRLFKEERFYRVLTERILHKHGQLVVSVWNKLLLAG